MFMCMIIITIIIISSSMFMCIIVISINSINMYTHMCPAGAGANKLSRNFTSKSK